MTPLLLLLLFAPQTPVVFDPKVPPPPPARASGKVRPAQWLRQPTPADLMSVYPLEALEKGVTGQVDLQCKSDVLGGLHDCLILSETPKGEGFGRVSLQLTSAYKLKVESRAAAAIGQLTTQITIRWIPPSTFPADGKPFLMARRDRVKWEGLTRPTRAVEGTPRLRLICRIGKDGRLETCAEPNAKTYDGTANWTLRRFKAEPLDRDGVPVAGKLVVIEVPVPTPGRRF